MNQKTLEKIQAEYKRIFGKVWEKGGGGGIDTNMASG